MAEKKTKGKSGRKPSIRLAWWHIALVFVLPLIIFGRSVGFDYVMHDDDKMIRDNPVLTQEGFSLATAFNTDAWFMDARIELYRPWQTITYMMDHAIGGTNPAVYHIHNLIVFALGALLLLYFLAFFLPQQVAWAGALLYSTMLLTPHAAGWIAARGDLYLMVFGLGFLIAVQKYLRWGDMKWLWISVPVFFLSLTAKESAVALLPIALVLMYTQQHRFVKGKELFWLIMCLAVFAGYYFLRSKSIADAGNFSITAFFSNLRSIPEEVVKSVLPVGFSVMPGYQVIWTVLGVIALGVMVFFVKKYTPSRSLLWTGLALWLLPLLPSMFYEPSFAGVAYDYLDHRAWFPFAGWWLIILGVVVESKAVQHSSMRYVFIALLVIWSAVNVWRVGVYAGWEPYYENALASNPNSGLANLNYGSLLRDKGDWAVALPYMERGVQLSPDYVDAKVRLAEAYFKTGKYPEAIAVSTQALEKEPNNIHALQFRGSSYGASGQSAQAIVDFQSVLAIQPDHPNGLFNLGLALKESNRLNEAVESFSKLILLQPDFPNAFYERGFCYGRMGLFPQAKADMEKSIEYQPEHGPSYFFRGRTFDVLGDLVSACEDWKKALSLGTTDAEPFVKERCN